MRIGFLLFFTVCIVLTAGIGFMMTRSEMAFTIGMPAMACVAGIVARILQAEAAESKKR